MFHDLFFWDEKQDSTGVVLPRPGGEDVRVHHNTIEKLLADSKFRAKHLRQLQFPLDRHYVGYGVFRKNRKFLRPIDIPDKRIPPLDFSNKLLDNP